MGLAWEEADRHSWLTVMVAGAGGAAAVLALVGLPPVDLHSPVHYLGLMDPLCGMTRAARLLALGDIRAAIAYNAASVGLAGAALLVIARFEIGTFSGRWASVVIRQRAVLLAAAFVLVALLWINQQLYADLLLGH